jgi:hypothetical protein
VVIGGEKHADPIRDFVGDAMGSLFVRFDRRRAKILEAAPEGVVEWPEMTWSAEASDREHHLRVVSHIELQHQEHVHGHAREVAGKIAAHLRVHPEGSAFVGGSKQDRAVLVSALEKAGIHVRGQTSTPVSATLPQAAADFRSVIDDTSPGD